MVMSVLLGFLATCIYASFMEWFVHRVGMHTKHLSKWAFRRHAIQHHAERRSLKRFYAPTTEHTVYRAWESSAVPVLWIAHFPLYWLVATLVNFWAAVGVAAGAAFYITYYEVLHFYVHTPRGHWFQRTRLFHFYCEYHRLHHHRAKWNYNLVMPLADWVLGTFSLDPMPAEPTDHAYVPRHTGPRSALARIPAEGE
jgi:hypothetical protein